MERIKWTEEAMKIVMRMVECIVFGNGCPKFKKKGLEIEIKIEQNGRIYLNQIIRLGNRKLSIYWLLIESYWVEFSLATTITPNDYCVLSVYNPNSDVWVEYYKDNCQWHSCLKKANDDVNKIYVKYDYDYLTFMYLYKYKQQELYDFYKASRSIITEYHTNKKTKAAADNAMYLLLELLEEVFSKTETITRLNSVYDKDYINPICLHE